MSSHHLLSASQVEAYDIQGYVVLENLIPLLDIAALKAAALEIVADFDIDQHRSVFSTTDRDKNRDDYFFASAEAVHCFLEEQALDENGNLVKDPHLAINKIGHALHDLHPAFRDFCNLDIFANLMHELGYEHPLLWQSMYIFKQPHIGGEVRWHQDASYLRSLPRNVTGVWIAIEDAHQRNGCLWVQPGGHMSPLREIYEVDWLQQKGDLKTLNQMPWPGNDEALPLEVTAGSVILFHDHMPHYSSPNRSSQSRHAFTLHIAEAASQWSAKNWLQRRTLPDFELKSSRKD
jgi:phytanoyl-CoA hydroxylase